MRRGETLIEMAARHVREGERHVERQKGVVERLQRDGLPVAVAEEMLAAFERILQDHRTSLERMLDERRRGLRDGGGALTSFRRRDS